MTILQIDRDAADALDDALGFLTAEERPIVEQALVSHREQATRELVEALTWIISHCEKLRNGTDDWFELVEISACARSALTESTTDAR